MPDSRTPQEREADDLLEKAIIAHRNVYYPHKNDQFIGDWMVIASWNDLEDTGNTAYSTIYPGARLPAHRCYGLLEIAHGLVEGEDD